MSSIWKRSESYCKKIFTGALAIRTKINKNWLIFTNPPQHTFFNDNFSVGQNKSNCFSTDKQLSNSSEHLNERYCQSRKQNWQQEKNKVYRKWFNLKCIRKSIVLKNNYAGDIEMVTKKPKSPVTIRKLVKTNSILMGLLLQ